MKRKLCLTLISLFLIVTFFSSCAQKNTTIEENTVKNEPVSEVIEVAPTKEVIDTVEKTEDATNVYVPEEDNATILEEEKLTCTLMVRCDTILNNMSKLSDEKKDIIPSDGIIFPKQSIVFEEGESVFDVLLRVMRENKIHLEYESTPSLNSTYIEGIANIYEFDCGSMSGWIYKVNEKSQNFGCSDYILKDGDFVEWIYSCDLGSDIY